MRSKCSFEQIIQILAEANLPGNSAASVCRKYSLSATTFYKWKQKYSNLSKDEARRLKVMEEENNSLKRLLADKELEIQLLRDIIKKNS